MLLILALVDVGARAWRPDSARLSASFSPFALNAQIDTARASSGPIIVLGDSVLWGYGVPADQTAVAKLRNTQAAPTFNLSFQGGSPVNTYFMLRLLLERGARPSVVIFNVNSKTFNPNDSAYRSLHPSLERAAADLLSASDRRVLDVHGRDDFSAQLDHVVSSVWRLYAIRADVRQTLFHADDAATALEHTLREATGEAQRERAAHVPTPERFLGTYDLAPLEDTNVSLRYLRAIRGLLAQHCIPYLAVLTPTNHTLLADYINVPEYRTNLALAGKAIGSSCGRVLDLDTAFPGRMFLDNDHLTSDGNTRLAKVLARALASLRS